MDDTFIVFKDISSQLGVLRQFIVVHPAFKFTYEAESEGRIAFLDVLLTKRTDESIGNLIRTNSWTGKYTGFLALYLYNTKKPEIVEEELNPLLNTLRENEYPRKFTNKYITT